MTPKERVGGPMKNPTRKSILIFCLSLFLISQSTLNARQDCSFACKSIPDENEVMATIGAPTLAAAPKTKTQRVVFWNIYKQRNDSFDQDFRNLTKNSNFLALSESALNQTHITQLKRLSTWKHYHAANFFLKNEVRTGVLVGSPYQAKSYGWNRTKELEPFVKAPKTQVWAKYAIEGSTDTLLIASIHGINWDGDASFQNQLNLMRSVFKAHKGPIIYGGDFNTKNANRNVIAKKFAAEFGMTQVVFPGRTSGKDYLDHVFVRQIKTVQALELNQVMGSDHKPLLLDFVM